LSKKRRAKMESVVLDALTDLYGSNEFDCSDWWPDLYKHLIEEKRFPCTGGEIWNAFRRLRLRGVLDKVRGDRKDAVWRLAEEVALTEDEYNKLPHVFGGAEDPEISFRNRRRFPQVALGNGVFKAKAIGDGVFHLEHLDVPVVPKPPDNIVELSRIQARCLHAWLGHHLKASEPPAPKKYHWVLWPVHDGETPGCVENTRETWGGLDRYDVEQVDPDKCPVCTGDGDEVEEG